MGKQTATDALVIVAKYPQPGKVKTRLGATIGHQQAAALYTAFLRDLSARFAAGERTGAYDLRWACVDDTPSGDDLRRLRALFDQWTGSADTSNVPGVADSTSALDAHGSAAQPLHRHDAPTTHGPQVFAQRGGDLADRLYNICADMRAAGYRRLIIHSSDSPHAALAVVQSAFALLDRRDVVVGPATDGGYYLIGLRLGGPTSGARAAFDETIGQAKDDTSETAGFPDLFQGVGMSEATTLQQTLARAAQLGLTVAQLPTTFDVDEAADLTRLADHLRRHGAQVAPHTATTLAGLAEADAAVGSE